MKIAVFGRSASEKNIYALKKLCELSTKYNLEVILSEEFSKLTKANESEILCHYEQFTDFDAIKDTVDVVFSIGGDGTLLHTVEFIATTEIPIVGINTGRLGFLAHFLVDELEEIIQNLDKDYYENDYRQILEVQASKNLFEKPVYALNEFTIQKRDPSAIIKVDAYLNDQFLSSYYADGIIFSTPTGSTGYNLSCNGPIIVPQSNSFSITPIAAHNLNLRPIIIPNTAVMTFRLREHRGDCYITADTKYWQVDDSFEFTVKKSNFAINILKKPENDFIETLRNKLSWGSDNRNQ